MFHDFKPFPSEFLVDDAQVFIRVFVSIGATPMRRIPRRRLLVVLVVECQWWETEFNCLQKRNRLTWTLNLIPVTIWVQRSRKPKICSVIVKRIVPGMIGSEKADDCV